MVNDNNPHQRHNYYHSNTAAGTSPPLEQLRDTQSETSTGLCGSNAVVGFNDSGSFADTLLNGTGGVSLSDVAVSPNRG